MEDGIYNKLKNIIRNNKQLINNVMGSFTIKGLAVLVNLIIMPAYMRYFSNNVVLGVWFTLISTISWILTFDLGIGNGLRNNLVMALVEKDELKVKRYVSSSYMIIGAISLFIMSVGYMLIGFVNWNKFFDVSENIITSDILIKTVRLMFLGIILQFFLKLITSVLNALQKTAVTNLIPLISNIIVLVYIIIYNENNIERSLIKLTVINMFSNNIPLLIATIIIFSTSLKRMKPNIKFYKKEYANDIVKLGGTFFWIQITFMVITATNEIIIAWIFGAEYVVEYQVYYKIFYLVITLFSLITNPVWSAITKAYAENRFDWIEKIGRVLNKVALLGSIAIMTVIPFLQSIINIWLGSNSITVNNKYAIIFAINSSVMMFVLSTTCLANGMGKLKFQFISNTFAAILKIPLAYILSIFYAQWICIIIANILLMLPCAIIQIVLINMQLRKESNIFKERLNCS